MIPVLLDASDRHKSLALTCCGKRGEWLIRFNKNWSTIETPDMEDGWHTGSLEQRKNILITLRQQDPAKARDWIQQSWPNENANSKTDLIRTMAVNAGDDDLPWLESLLNE